MEPAPREEEEQKAPAAAVLENRGAQAARDPPQEDDQDVGQPDADALPDQGDESEEAEVAEESTATPYLSGRNKTKRTGVSSLNSVQTGRVFKS